MNETVQNDRNIHVTIITDIQVKPIELKKIICGEKGRVRERELEGEREAERRERESQRVSEREAEVIQRKSDDMTTKMSERERKRGRKRKSEIVKFRIWRNR